MSFKVGSFLVYPSHGVGKIVSIETIKVGEQNIDLWNIYFSQEKLNIKVPISQEQNTKVRPVASKKTLEKVVEILKSAIKKQKCMWSRRAQEYENKINSGDIILLAEVLRDLTRSKNSNRSYSERVIYETAVYRLASEYAIIKNISIEKAKTEIANISNKKIKDSLEEDNKDDFEDDNKDLDDDEDDE